MDRIGILVCILVFVFAAFLLFSTMHHTNAIDYQVFDLAQYDDDLRGFYGVIFHEGFVYFTPDHNGTPFGKFVRYDTSKTFDDIASWQTFDSSVIYDGAGYLGGGTDGKFLYFSSYNDDVILRYGVVNDFQDRASWEMYRTGMKFWGETSFDGRFVYFLPMHHAMLTRFDTQGNFSSKTSWQSCDVSSISESVDFMGSSFDGQFLYIPSSGGKFILKYDTQKQFCDSTSWEKFNVLQITNRKGYSDAKFDGRFVYFSPYRNDGLAHGSILRYDTAHDFASPDSWSSFNPSLYGVKGAKGYGMMVLTKDRLYFSPLVNWKGYHSNILSYDVHADFNQIDSWSISNVASYNNDLRGYPAAASDGDFIYFSPYHNNLEKHGKILRIVLP